MSGETKEAVSPWTVDSLKEYVEARIVHKHAQIEALRELIESRLLAHEQALSAADQRYAQRFAAQEAALVTAMVASDKAVSAALAAAKEAVIAALIAADRAVAKSEAASEKRFESVNEFRAQLREQAGSLISRDEANARFIALVDKYDLLLSRHTELEKHVTEVRSLGVGRSSGAHQLWGVIVGAVGVAGGVVAIAISLLRR